MHRPPLRLILASASPRRAALLRQVGLEPTVTPTRIDEHRWHGETSAELVKRLSEAKAREAASRLEAEPNGGAVIVAADTEVALGGRTLGKPRDAAQARSMLLELRGREHEVLTGVFVLRTDDGRSAGGVAATRVRFRSFDERTLDAYVRSGEPLDKAGAYGIQERGALLVERIDGSWANVVGLPVERLPAWFERLGLDLMDWLDGA